MKYEQAENTFLEENQPYLRGVEQRILTFWHMLFQEIWAFKTDAESLRWCFCLYNLSL